MHSSKINGIAKSVANLELLGSTCFLWGLIGLNPLNELGNSSLNDGVTLNQPLTTDTSILLSNTTSNNSTSRVASLMTKEGKEVKFTYCLGCLLSEQMAENFKVSLN
jgi:hypothetical protein